MCLARINEYLCSPICEAEGYKVFLKNSKGEYVPEFYSPDGSRRYYRLDDDVEKRKQIKPNVVLKAVKTTIHARNNQKYDTGFHAFVTKKDAQGWIRDTDDGFHDRFIVKVKLRKVFLKGQQSAWGYMDDRACLVAEEMIVPEPTCEEKAYVPR